MAVPVVAQKAPYAVEVEAGKTYFWCSCGQSSRQPFCDGAHKDSVFAPKPYKAEASETVYFCGCKFTHSAPLCDGAHSTLTG
jgi:CDGSH-type Zn-finger protein